ncbi:MAG: DMT family transporter [Candidatus Nomurabacteria bacterium]|nr:DMT family transporter [Candidatus Nomurabacteria bacterium]
MNKRSKWFLLGLLAVLIGAPNSMLVRTALSGDAGTDSLTLLLLRYIVASVVLFVPLYKFVRAKYSVFRKSFKNLLIYTTCSVVGTYTWLMAVEQSSASYASTIALLSPIILVVLSAKLVKDRITRRAAAGVSLATIGGMLVVAMPAIFQGSATSDFYPMATLLLLLDCVLAPISMIYQRRTDERGVPLSVSVGFMALIAVVAVMTTYIFTRGGNVMIDTVTTLPWQVWLVVIYSAFAVNCIARVLVIKSYEYTGAAVRGGLSYLETLLAIALPLIILGEHLSMEMIAGAMLILMGVFLAESGGKNHLSKLGLKPYLRRPHHYGRMR